MRCLGVRRSRLRNNGGSLSPQTVRHCCGRHAESTANETMQRQFIVTQNCQLIETVSESLRSLSPQTVRQLGGSAVKPAFGRFLSEPLRRFHSDDCVTGPILFFPRVLGCSVPNIASLKELVPWELIACSAGGTMEQKIGSRKVT